MFVPSVLGTIGAPLTLGKFVILCSFAWSLPLLAVLLPSTERPFMTLATLVAFDALRYLGLKKYVAEAD